MAEKIIKYEVDLVVNHHNPNHIKKFENVLHKLLNTSGMNNTELVKVKQMK